MFCGDTQSTKDIQGIQSVFVAPVFCPLEQAYLPPFSPMLSLCSPASWKEGQSLPLHTFPVPEHMLSLAWNVLPLHHALYPPLTNWIPSSLYHHCHLHLFLFQK